MSRPFDERHISTFSSCKDLARKLIGQREALIMINDKFRLDLEEKCYMASHYNDLQEENLKLQICNRKLFEENMRLRKELNLHGRKMYINDLEVKEE